MRVGGNASRTLATVLNKSEGNGNKKLRLQSSQNLNTENNF